ncbi:MULTISPECIES: Nif11-like leader peptide family natural product precursor [Aerosakkonema]|uniref:Nif11-like leader peptide family natural product precursor n=1 Tax=Aerosakkonema TaxID=1246629 RepID=UPI0035BA7677
MTQESAARFFKAIQQDEALKAKLKATKDPETFVKIAGERGYQFTVEDLHIQIEKLSPEEIASAINPGVGPRRHLVPR